MQRGGRNVSRVPPIPTDPVAMSPGAAIPPHQQNLRGVGGPAEGELVLIFPLLLFPLLIRLRFPAWKGE